MKEVAALIERINFYAGMRPEKMGFHEWTLGMLNTMKEAGIALARLSAPVPDKEK